MLFVFTIFVYTVLLVYTIFVYTVLLVYTIFVYTVLFIYRSKPLLIAMTTHCFIKNMSVADPGFHTRAPIPDRGGGALLIY